MNVNIKILLALAIAALTGVSCATTSNPAYTEHQTECISTSLDGKQTLRVWAKGRNDTDATMQCLKKAVYDVTFYGITAGNTTADSRPILTSPDLRDKYEDYFNLFFADGGDFMAYVIYDNQYNSTKKLYKTSGFYMKEMVVQVDRTALKKRYIDDNILR